MIGLQMVDVHQYGPDKWGRKFRTCVRCLHRCRTDDEWSRPSCLECPKCGGLALLREDGLPAGFWGVMWLLYVVRVCSQVWYEDLMHDDSRLRFALMELD